MTTKKKNVHQFAYALCYESRLDALGIVNAIVEAFENDSVFGLRYRLAGLPSYRGSHRTKGDEISTTQFIDFIDLHFSSKIKTAGTAERYLRRVLAKKRVQARDKANQENVTPIKW